MKARQIWHGRFGNSVSGGDIGKYYLFISAITQALLRDIVCFTASVGFSS